ncbi:hypothetical protein VN1336_10050 [Helicobacter pylori]
MNFKKAIIAYLPRKTHGKYREKKIIFFAIMKPLSGALKTPIKKHKKGAYYHGKQKRSSG